MAKSKLKRETGIHLSKKFADPTRLAAFKQKQTVLDDLRIDGAKPEVSIIYWPAEIRIQMLPVRPFWRGKNWGGVTLQDV